METERVVRNLQSNRKAIERFTAGQLCAFIESLDRASTKRRLANELVFGTSVSTVEIAPLLNLPEDEVTIVMECLLSCMLKWQRSGRRSRTWWVAPDSHMLLRSMDELKSALVTNLDDDKVARIEREVESTFAAEVEPERATPEESDLHTAAEVVRRIIQATRELDLSAFALPELEPVLGANTEDKILGTHPPIPLVDLMEAKDSVSLPQALRGASLYISGMRTRMQQGSDEYVLNVFAKGASKTRDRLHVGFCCGRYSSGMRALDPSSGGASPIAVAIEPGSPLVLVVRIDHE